VAVVVGVAVVVVVVAIAAVEVCSSGYKVMSCQDITAAAALAAGSTDAGTSKH